MSDNPPGLDEVEAWNDGYVAGYAAAREQAANLIMDGLHKDSESKFSEDVADAYNEHPARIHVVDRLHHVGKCIAAAIRAMTPESKESTNENAG